MKNWTSFYVYVSIWNGKRDETHPCQSTKPVSYDFFTNFKAKYPNNEQYCPLGCKVSIYRIQN